jgi:hypothetical protein
MGTPFLNDKTSTEGIKKFLSPKLGNNKLLEKQTQNRVNPRPTHPDNRILPIRGR